MMMIIEIITMVKYRSYQNPNVENIILEKKKNLSNRFVDTVNKKNNFNHFTKSDHFIKTELIVKMYKNLLLLNLIIWDLIIKSYFYFLVYKDTAYCRLL